MTAGSPATTRRDVTGARRALPPIAAGAVAGLAWAAGLRGFMVEVAGPGSTFDWLGTFEGILLPGLLTGALLGWAAHLRRSGDDRYRRRLAAAPLVFVAANPYVLVTVFTEGGIGGGALALPLFGMAGGYALAGRGSRGWRVAAGVLAVLAILAWPVLSALVPGAITSPRGAWVAVLWSSSLAVLCLACAIPHRAAVPAAP